jgi:hypothetical protein
VNRERDKQDVRDRRDSKFEVRGSKFRKPRTSDLEPSSFSPVPIIQHSYCVSLVPLFSRVSFPFPDFLNSTFNIDHSTFPLRSTSADVVYHMLGEYAKREFLMVNVQCSMRGRKWVGAMIDRFGLASTVRSEGRPKKLLVENGS